MKDIDWTSVWEVERDVCFLYHELSEVRGITGDLAFGSVYAQPYWEFLDLTSFQMPDSERIFIRDGCLIFIIVMAWDVIDGSGSYILDKIVQCQQSIGNLVPLDDNDRQLIYTASLALSAAETGTGSSRELESLSVWVNTKYVRGYFERMAIKTSH